MRWPLRNKILIRLIPLLIVAVVAVTLVNLQSVTAVNRQVYVNRVQQIADLVTSSRFPLTSNVLDNMRLLSDAEFLVFDANGNVQAKSSGAPSPASLPDVSKTMLGKIEVENVISVDGERYIHTVVPYRESQATESANREMLVHILVDQAGYRALWIQSVRTPLLVSAVILPLTLIIGLALASNVTRPLSELQTNVRRIADGDLTELSDSAGNDEIGDLRSSMNEMVLKLRDHQNNLRKNERLQTLVQIGSGIAHNLKNCTTGCKMAIELLAMENQAAGRSENLQVASRQLALMNGYIDRFLAVGRSGEENRTSQAAEINLVTVLDSALFLLGPMMKHLGVEHTRVQNSDHIMFWMDRDDAEQMMINLITNAVEAASSRAVSNPQISAVVQVELQQSKAGIEFRVIDNGEGPPSEIADSIEKPFVSGKPEGVGLGLSLVHDIATSHGGELQWMRVGEETRFNVRFNLPTTEG